MGGYEPMGHAAMLQLSIVYMELPGTLTGRWMPDKQRIELQTGMGLIAQRSVLAHELVHAEHDDRPTRLTKLKIEHRADVVAADRLIERELLTDLRRWRPDSPETWCRELRVSPHLLRVYLGQCADRISRQ